MSHSTLRDVTLQTVANYSRAAEQAVDCYRAGGQRLITELEVESGVPVLSKIPILNRFFTNRVESKEEQTLLILLKPTVIIQNEQEERAYPGLSDSVRSGLNFLRQ